MVSSTNTRVRYQETDKFGVVYYANYYVWFEIGRTEFFREIKFPYSNWEENGLYIVIASSSCEYKKPAYYDDAITIRSWISELKNSSFTFEYEILRNNELLATGRTVQVMVDKDKKAVRIPRKIKEILVP